MATGTENYLSLVRQAFSGDLKLPAFQRDFKWTRKQVIRLYDSIRQSYPLGSIIVLEGTKAELKEREFRGATIDALSKAPKRLVLDGQQRLTAGIDLFYAESEESAAQYFIDIERVETLIADRQIDIDNDGEICRFLSDLDDDEGYCIARARVSDHHSLLNQKHLIATDLLRPDNSKMRDFYIEQYEAKHPSRKKLIRNVIKPHFVIHASPDIPYVAIDSSLQLDSISRIFSTLNSSGKVLTPFELIVAVLYSSEIDLRDDLDVVRKAYPFVRQMDQSGEIVLQTVVMLCGKNPKKSLLPKTLKAEDWQKYRDKASKFLNEVGKFLTNQCGMALDRTSALIPYDSIFVPMAIALDRVNYSSMSPAEQGAVNQKLSQWLFGSSLDQRYQEGVHNKQVKDLEEIVTWIFEGDDKYKPSWLKDVRIPSLTSVSTKGAVANLLRCLINMKSLQDPLTGAPVNFGMPDTHAHHIFPTKYVDKMAGWNPKIGDKSDIFLNLMQVSSQTNIAYLNDNPREQVLAGEKIRSVEFVQSAYAIQGVDSDAYNLLRKPDKSREDFSNFLKLRETYFEKMLMAWGFSRYGDSEIYDDMEIG